MSADRRKQCRLKAESHYESAYRAFVSLADSSSLESVRVQLERVALCEYQLASKTVHDALDSSLWHAHNYFTIISQLHRCHQLDIAMGESTCPLNHWRPCSCRRRSTCLEQSSSRSVPIRDIFYFQNTPEVISVQHIIPFSLTVSLPILCTEPLKPLVLHMPL